MRNPLVKPILDMELLVVRLDVSPSGRTTAETLGSPASKAVAVAQYHLRPVWGEICYDAAMALDSETRLLVETLHKAPPAHLLCSCASFYARQRGDKGYDAHVALSCNALANTGAMQHFGDRIRDYFPVRTYPNQMFMGSVSSVRAFAQMLRKRDTANTPRLPVIQAWIACVDLLGRGEGHTPAARDAAVARLRAEALDNPATPLYDYAVDQF